LTPPIPTSETGITAPDHYRRPLRERSAPPEKYIRPGFYRSREKVAPALRKCFNDLIRGNATWPLYLHGDTGRGKTAAGLAMVDYIDRSCFRTLDELLDMEMHGHRDAQRSAWKWLAAAQLLVVDELAARQKVGDLETSVLLRLLDLREEKGRVGVYISNVPPDALKTHYDRRVVSRLLCGTWFHLEGIDRRPDPDRN
jgi:DNA replication protein DnaC